MPPRAPDIRLEASPHRQPGSKLRAQRQWLVVVPEGGARWGWVAQNPRERAPGSLGMLWGSLVCIPLISSYTHSPHTALLVRSSPSLSSAAQGAHRGSCWVWALP